MHSLERELSLLLINSGKYLGKIYFTTKILFLIIVLKSYLLLCFFILFFPDPATPYLIFSNRHELRSISLKNGMGVKALISSLKNTIALDFYHTDNEDIIFWTDVVDDKIYKGTLLAGCKFFSLLLIDFSYLII